MISSDESVNEVLTNRDLLQRIVRLGVGAPTDSDAPVPFKPGQNSDWSSYLLVNHFWKDVTRDLALHAPLCAHISTPESLQHAQDARFHVQECHVEIRNALTQLHSLAASPLAERLRSITLSDWSVVHSGILLWIQTAADEGRFPALESMAFNRVIPSQHLLPAQVRSVALREIRPPYNSELGSEVGTFYLRLLSLERLESLDIAYVDVGTYSMRLHAVRLTELLYLPRLRKLRLAVPGLHDDVDAAAFLGANFMRQLREGCLESLDITLLSEGEDGKQGLARLVQEVCEKAGDLFACTYYGPGHDKYSHEPRAIFKRRIIPRLTTLQAFIRRGHETGKLQLDTDMTKQLLSSKSVMRVLMSADQPVHLHFGWHMTCEEINRIARLPLKVGGIEWFCKEQRGMQALHAPEWRDPEKTVLSLRNLEVRGDEKWLPAKFAALQELSLRGRPRCFMVPPSCTNLSLAYHGGLPRCFMVPPSCMSLSLASHDGRAVTQGLDSLQHVCSLTLEHVKVACLPPLLEDLRLVRCRLPAVCPLPTGRRLRSLAIQSCSGQGVWHPLFIRTRAAHVGEEALQSGSPSSPGGSNHPIDLEHWVMRTRPQYLSVSGTQVSVGSSWADFADALALSKLGAARIEGCQLASATEGASQHPDALVSHIDALLDNVFQVVVSPPKEDRPYRCTINRRASLDAAPALVLAPEP